MSNNLTTNDNLIAATILLREYYAFDARLTSLYYVINNDSSDETSAMLREKSDHIVGLIKEMIDTAALEGSEAA